MVVVLACAVLVTAAASQGAQKPDVRAAVLAHLKAKYVSAGTRGWLHPPDGARGGDAKHPFNTPHFGTNVDAASPQEDVAGGQSETAIAAATTAGGEKRVLVAFNDSSG